MKSHFQPKFLTLICLGALGTPAQPDSIPPRLEISTLANLDIGGIPPADLSTDDTPIELADAEIGGTLRLRQDMQVQALFVHQDGAAAFDQAFATWKAPAATLAFGKQALPLGLFAGRLIHDPLLQADLETIAPSILVGKEIGFAKMLMALASEPRDSDSGETKRSTATVGALDLEWPERANLRLSGKLATRLRILDLGAEWRIGDFLVDLEGFAANGAWARARWAALAGLTWRCTETFGVSVRFDARRTPSPGDWNRSIAVGATQRFAEIAYLGAEWLQDLEKDGILTLRLGLEAPLGIP